MPAPRALVVWRPDWLVSVVRLTAAAASGELTFVRFEPERWPGLVATVRAEDGWHFLCRANEATHRLWWPAHNLPAAGTPLGFACALDAHAVERGAAGLRFWRAVVSRRRTRAPPDRSKPPDPKIRRRIAVLRALDGWLAGAPYRAIAEVLLGSPASPPAAWKTSSRRGRVIRLVATGRRLTEGGYRALLTAPRPRFSAQ